jgi:hypothetical protein
MCSPQIYLPGEAGRSLLGRALKTGTVNLTTISGSLAGRAIQHRAGRALLRC